MEGQKDLNWPPWFQEYASQDLICAFNLSEVAYQKNSLLSWGAFMKKPCFAIFTPTDPPPHRALVLYTAFVYTVFPPTISPLHLPHYYIVFLLLLCDFPFYPLQHAFISLNTHTISCLYQMSEKYGLPSKSSLPSIFVNIILLEQSHTRSFMYCLQLLFLYKGKIEQLSQ